jgi:hypothetical protein
MGTPSALHRAGRRLLQLLGLVLEEVCEPVTDPMAEQPDTEWCNDTLHLHGDTHTCDLEVGHGGGLHACACGEDWPTAAACDRLLRAIKLADTYGECLWPEDDVCPLHDSGAPWPAGRDCLGTCTNCNALTNQWHEPSCLYHDPLTEHRELDALAQWKQQQLRILHGKAPR